MISSDQCLQKRTTQT